MGDFPPFTIVNGELRVAAVLDHEAGGSYSIRVRATDQGGLWYEESQNRLWSTWAIDYPDDTAIWWTKTLVVRTLNSDGTITFTPADALVPRTVTLRGVDDPLPVVRGQQLEELGDVLGPEEAQEDLQRLLLAVAKQGLQLLGQVLGLGQLAHAASGRPLYRRQPGVRLSA